MSRDEIIIFSESYQVNLSRPKKWNDLLRHESGFRRETFQNWPAICKTYCRRRFQILYFASCFYSGLSLLSYFSKQFPRSVNLEVRQNKFCRTSHDEFFKRVDWFQDRKVHGSVKMSYSSQSIRLTNEILSFHTHWHNARCALTSLSRANWRSSVPRRRQLHVGAALHGGDTLPAVSRRNPSSCSRSQSRSNARARQRTHACTHARVARPSSRSHARRCVVARARARMQSICAPVVLSNPRRHTAPQIPQRAINIFSHRNTGNMPPRHFFPTWRKYF